MAFINDGAIIQSGPVALSGGGMAMGGAGTVIAQNVSIIADLIKPAFIRSARALGSTRIRVEFSLPIIVDNALRDPSNYQLLAVAPSVVPVISSIDFPVSAVYVSAVDLITSEMTGGVTNYSVKIKNLTAADDSPFAQDPYAFDGIGIKPTVLVALALDANTVQVQFNEKVLDLGSIRVASAYTFDLGLSVTSVLSVDASSVTLKTSNQVPGQLYTLTMTGTWYDVAMNAFVSGSTTKMLGYVTPAAKAPLLTLSMYNFLIEGIRNSDQKEGAQFIERFLMGPQSIWSATMQTIFDLPTLWDVSAIPDELLQYMKRIVGWTPDLDPITNSLDALTLRRLIAASVRFWKTRGPEESISDILSLTTGARAYILNWFDVRFIADETILGEEHTGVDPWLESTPGEGDPDYRTYNIRIVDDGKLDHALVRNLAKLTRPSGERVQINYLGFLDQFTSDGDETQWAFAPDLFTTHSVANGALRFDTNANSSQRALVIAPNNQEWEREVISWTFSTSMVSPRLIFYAIGDSTVPATVTDYYFVQINTERDPNAATRNKIAVWKRVAGVDTLLASFNTMDWSEPFRINVKYTVRVVVTNVVEGIDANTITVYWDGDQVISTQDNALGQGTLGIEAVSGIAATSYFQLEELEMFFLPRALDFIDINDVVTSIVPQPVIPPTVPVIALPVGAIVNNSIVQLINNSGQGLVQG